MSTLIDQIDEKIIKYKEELSTLRVEYMRKEQSIKLIIDKLNKHKKELLLEKPEDLYAVTGDLKRNNSSVEYDNLSDIFTLPQCFK